MKLQKHIQNNITMRQYLYYVESLYCYIETLSIIDRFLIMYNLIKSVKFY